MGFVVFIILLTLFLWSYKKRKNVFSPDVLFLFLWAIIILLSSMQLFGIYEASDKVYLIILVGSISFLFGCSNGYKKRIKRSEFISKNDIINKQWFWILSLIIILFKIEPFIESYVSLLSGKDASELRADYFDATRSIGDMVLSVFGSLISPLLQATGILFFLKNMKKNFPYMLVVLVIVIMDSTITGGRFGFAYVLIELVVCYFIIRTKYPGSIHISKLLIISLVAFFVIAIVVVSYARGINNENLLSHYYMYLCGNVVYFDMHIKIIETHNWHPLVASCWGFWYQIFPLLHFIGIPYPDWYLDVGRNVMNTQDLYQIGDDMITNAFITPFYYLYADARWLGVILGMGLYGYIAMKLYCLMMNSNQNIYIVMYMIMVQSIFMTIYNYPLVNSEYVLIALLFVIVKKYYS